MEAPATQDQARKPFHVLWGCGGVLVDSELTATHIAVNDIINALVGQTHISDEERQELMVRFAGLQIEQMLELAERRYSVTSHVSVTDHEARIETIRQDIVRAMTEVEPVYGIPLVLARLSERGVQHSVVTNNDLERATTALNSAMLMHYFRNDDNGYRIFSAQDSTAMPIPKPSPEVYLHAIDTLGIQASDAVAVSSSVYGVRAAITAGLTVIGYAGASHITDKVAHCQRLVDAGTNRETRVSQVVAVSQPTHLLDLITSRAIAHEHGTGIGR